MADNFNLRRKRVTSLLEKLRKQPDVLEAYERVIKEQIGSGVLQKVVEDVVTEIGGTYYMRHHLVIRKVKETTKLRIVYDASSEALGPSLIEALHEGPRLLAELVKVLLPLRFFKVGIIADLEKHSCKSR